MEGNKTYRHKQNPEEKRFHDEFIMQHGDRDMSAIVLEPNETGIAPSRYLTSEEEKIVISAMQWLGSPLGQSFLRDMGYEKQPETPKKKMTDNNRRYIAKRCRNNTSWKHMCEANQDDYLEIICERLDFTLEDFYATDGKFLNKILKR